MAVHKRKMSKVKHRSCEALTVQRALQLGESGSNCAKDAKAKGLTIDDHRGYLYLMGDNNTKAWLTGWENEFKKI